MVVESLQRSPQTAIHPPCLLMDSGSERGGGAIPSIRLSVSLHERRREQVDGVSHQLVFERDAGITMSFFSCTEAGFHVQFLTSCSFAVEDRKNIYDLGA